MEKETHPAFDATANGWWWIKRLYEWCPAFVVFKPHDKFAYLEVTYYRGETGNIEVAAIRQNHLTETIFGGRLNTPNETH